VCLVLPVLGPDGTCRFAPGVCPPAAPLPSDEALVRDLIAVLDETKSPPIFSLTVEVLTSMKSQGRRALPAALRCAERLGIDNGMGTCPATELRRLVEQALPAAAAEPVPSAGSMIMLTGTVARPEDISLVLAAARSVVGSNVVNALRVPGTTQVQLDVLIAEVVGRHLRSVVSCINAEARRQTEGGTTFEVASGIVKDKQQLLERLQALRSEGRAKILSEPRLTTLSGKQASFFSGQSLAVLVPQSAGGNTVRFEDIGTRVDLLPLVLADTRIRLEAKPVISTVNPTTGAVVEGKVVPGCCTHQLEATADMRPGQTFALALRKQDGPGTAATGLVILITPHRIDPNACQEHAE
jgi:Flp pilus assembly secretin CpaC